MLDIFAFTHMNNFFLILHFILFGKKSFFKCFITENISRSLERDERYEALEMNDLDAFSLLVSVCLIYDWLIIEQLRLVMQKILRLTHETQFFTYLNPNLDCKFAKQT